MSLFNTNTLIPSVQGSQQIQVSPTLPTPQNNIFIFGNRRPATPAETGGLPILKPQNGYPLYEYYQTYKLPTQYLNDPTGMLAYFTACGFTVNYGYSATVTLNNVAAVDVTTNAAQNQAILYYTNSAQSVQPLVGKTINGVFTDVTQPTITGDFVSAQVGSFTYLSNTYDSKVIISSSQFATIAVNDQIRIGFINNQNLIPDANRTEPFIMNLYQAIQAALIPINANSTVATPNVYFAILPDSAKSGLFGPTSSTLALTVPTDVSTDTVTFAIPSSNVAYIPFSPLGNTSITQATTAATGIVMSSVVNGGELIVTLGNVSGTFNTTDICSLKLDPTQTVMQFQLIEFASQKISLQQFALPYQVTTSTDITTTYAPAFEYVAQLNTPVYSNNGQGLCFIAFVNISILPNLATMNLPSNTNNYQYEPIYYPYFPAIGDLPLSAGQVAAASAMVFGSNVFPLNPQGGVIINGLPVTASKSSYLPDAIDGIGDQVMQLGWNAVTVNGQSQAYVINPITGQITYPGLPTPAPQFRYLYVWQSVDYLKLVTNTNCQSLGLGQVRQTPTILSKLKSDEISDMLDMQTAGILQNVQENESLITITQNASNPTFIDFAIPASIVPGLEGINYMINIISAPATTQQTTTQ